MINLENLCTASCKIIQEVGDFIKGELGKVSEQAIEKKYLNNLVSYVDKTAENRLVSGFKELLPEAGFIAEEGASTNEENDYRWIIDPLDGTTNFLHQLPFFAISVALQYKKETVLGIVYEVSRQELFYAWKDGGAFLNGKSIQVSATNDMKDALLATGFPYYDFEHIDNYLAMIKPLMLHTRGLRRMGSAALDLVYVASGRFDAYFEYSLSPWDVAAGALIVQEAGGKVGDFSGGDNYLFGREIVAGNPSIYSGIIQRTLQYFKS